MHIGRKAIITAAMIGSMLGGGAVGAALVSAGSGSAQREAQENAGQVPTVP